MRFSFLGRSDGDPGALALKSMLAAESCCCGGEPNGMEGDDDGDELVMSVVSDIGAGNT
jgi:hypothetical protein